MQSYEYILLYRVKVKDSLFYSRKLLTMNKILQILTVLLLFMIGIIHSAEAKINLFEKPRYIPKINVYDDNGNAYGMSDFKADLLIALVWSKTCGPCLEDLRHLGSFVEQTKTKGIEVILISPEKDWKNVTEKRAFLRRLSAANMISFNDKNSRFKDGMGILVTPTAILINKDGEEAGQITGSVEWDNPKVIKYLTQLREKISKQLDERKAADEQD